MRDFTNPEELLDNQLKSENLSVQQNLTSLQNQIDLACKNIGRDPKSILLLAVSKKQPLSKLKEIAYNYDSGHKHFAENYVQHIIDRQKHFPHLQWHFIGRLQSNKLKFVIGNIYLIHSMGDIKHLQLADKLANKKNIVQDILLQVNFSDQITKQGFTKNQLEDAFIFLEKSQYLKCKGLMTLPPLTQNPQNSRIYFRQLKILLESSKQQFNFLKEDFKELSMGTSQDFIVAIEEGATIVRLGQCLFGPRVE